MARLMCTILTAMSHNVSSQCRASDNADPASKHAAPFTTPPNVLRTRCFVYIMANESIDHSSYPLGHELLFLLVMQITILDSNLSFRDSSTADRRSVFGDIRLSADSSPIAVLWYHSCYSMLLEPYVIPL
jgi:hypothetical protein